MAQPFAQRLQERSGTRLANLRALIRGAAPDLGLDRVERRDSLQRFGGNRGLVRLVDLVEGAPRMRPARGFPDAFPIEVAETGAMLSNT
jgi:hypothetical protein